MMELTEHSLGEIYRNLSTWLESIERSPFQVRDMSRMVCHAVLEEDLRTLMEECEEYLLEEQQLPESQFESLELRSLTVLEEVKRFMRS